MIDTATKASEQTLILPYVPSILETDLFEGQAHQVLDNWSTTLSHILSLADVPFWTEIYANDTLRTFLDAFLREFPRGPGSVVPPLEADIAKRVLCLFIRMVQDLETDIATNTLKQLYCETMESASELTSPAVYLNGRGVLTVCSLLDIAAIYYSPADDVERSLDVQIRTILHTAFRLLPNVATELGNAATTICGFLSPLCHKYERLEAKRGKQPVRLKTPMSSSRASDDAVDSHVATKEAEQRIALVNDYAKALMDISHHLCCLFRAYPPAATAFHDEKVTGNAEFLHILMFTYNTVLPGMLVEMGGALDNALSGAMKYMKYMFTAVVYYFLEGCYFKVGEMEKANNRNSEDPDNEFALNNLNEDGRSKFNDLCDEILWMLEQSQQDGPYRFMHNAPLILDLEIEWNLSRKLKEINDTIFNGDDARIDFVVMSLDHLRSANESGVSVKSALKKKEEEKFRKLNNLESQGSAPQNVGIVDMPTNEDSYIQRTSLISQVQDLFPDLGDGYIEAFLVEFNNNAETVIMKLLEGDLPPRLASLDKSLPRPPVRITEPSVESITATLQRTSVDDFYKEENLLRKRRNAFDDDEFDMFGKNATQLNRDNVIIGKKRQGTADALLDDKSFVEDHKESMLDTLYDDEYDDTYDTNDVLFGKIDIAAVEEPELTDSRNVPASDEETAEDTLQNKIENVDPAKAHEATLIQTFMKNPNVFARSAAVRRGKERAELKKQTGLSDEILEGWYIMFLRNPRKDSIIRKYTEDTKPQQNFIPRTAYRGVPDEESGTSSGAEDGAVRRAPHGRGRGGGRGSSTAVKERNKASRANHSRKNQRDKKINRGMGGGSVG